MSGTDMRPINDVEIALRFHWNALLETVPGARSNFFDDGGHSLLAAELVDGLEQQLGVPIPLELVFEHPIFGEMVAALGEVTRQPLS
jgi:acyl carrier protein